MDTIHGTWNNSPDAVTLIDAHHHLWDLSQRKHPNLIGEPRHDFFMGDDSALRRNYLPDDYKRDAAGHNVLTTVHCEAEWDRADQIGETRWITQIHAEYGFPGAIVAHAWFDTDNAEEVIAAQAAFPLVRGIRSKPVTASSPDRHRARARPARCRTSAGCAASRCSKNTGCRGICGCRSGICTRPPRWRAPFRSTAIVLNHTGFPWDRSEEGLRAWRRGMEILAREPNVQVKVSEFGLKDREWEYESNRRVVLDALAIFGVERAMFATNFPVAGLRIGYGALVEAMSRMLAHLSPEQRDLFFWKNAKAFYRL